MRKLVSRLPLFGLALLFVPATFADDSRAQDVLKQARQALGGEERLQKIQGLHIDGHYRRVFGDRQMGGDREISILLPNKYLVEDAMNAGGLSTAMINTRGLNGERAWNASSGGGGGMIFRMGGPGGQQATPEEMEATFRRAYQAEFSRYLLAIVLMPPPSFAVEYKYAGESEVEDAQVDSPPSLPEEWNSGCASISDYSPQITRITQITQIEELDCGLCYWLLRYRPISRMVRWLALKPARSIFLICVICVICGYF